MKIALEAIGFITNDILYNKNKIINTIKYNKGKVDLIVFGETYLQGFQCLSWEYEQDKEIAICKSNETIVEIQKCARQNRVAVSFGYIEKNKNKIYSSQITIDKDGKIISNFHRVSTGWKEPSSDNHYCEGKKFPKFKLLGKTFSIGLCGDFWYEENCASVKKLNIDIVLWPVYTDFNYEKWNTSIKFEYAEQAAKISNTVLYVNSYCLDVEDIEIARGGAALFQNGKIVSESPAGKEDVLIIQID